MDINETALQMAERVREYIRKTYGFQSDFGVNSYWNSLSDSAKVQLFHQALDKKS